MPNFSSKWVTSKIASRLGIAFQILKYHLHVKYQLQYQFQLLMNIDLLSIKLLLFSQKSATSKNVSWSGIAFQTLKYQLHVKYQLQHYTSHCQGICLPLFVFCSKVPVNFTD